MRLCDFANVSTCLCLCVCNDVSSTHHTNYQAVCIYKCIHTHVYMPKDTSVFLLMRLCDFANVSTCLCLCVFVNVSLCHCFFDDVSLTHHTNCPGVCIYKCIHTCPKTHRCFSWCIFVSLLKCRCVFVDVSLLMCLCWSVVVSLLMCLCWCAFVEVSLCLCWSVFVDVSLLKCLWVFNDVCLEVSLCRWHRCVVCLYKCIHTHVYMPEDTSMSLLKCLCVFVEVSLCLCWSVFESSTMSWTHHINCQGTCIYKCIHTHVYMPKDTSMSVLKYLCVVDTDVSLVSTSVYTHMFTCPKKHRGLHSSICVSLFKCLCVFG